MKDMKQSVTSEIRTEIKGRLKDARRVVCLTGAGVSAESGVPTFRGAGGLWSGHKATDLATPAAFERDPKLVWEFYDFRRRNLASIEPNPAHYALARFAEENKKEFTLITQNVDGLHALAGSRDLLELHGNIWRVRCLECGVISDNRDVPIAILPYCECGGLLRPDIVWFGEALPEVVFASAFEASRRADIIFVVGTSGVVEPAASLARLTKEGGGFTVEINPEPTPLSSMMDMVVNEKAGEFLPTVM